MTARVMNLFEAIGFSWLVSLMKLFTLQNPKEQLEHLVRSVGVPLFAFALFLGIWHVAAGQVDTSLGKVPGPAAVWEQAGSLWQEHKAERQKEAAAISPCQRRGGRKNLPARGA